MRFKPHPLKPRLASGKRQANRLGKKTQKEEKKRFSRNFGKKTEGKKITKSNRRNHPIFRPPLTIGRVEVKPDHIGQFFQKLDVPRELESARPMRLKIMFLP